MVIVSEIEKQEKKKNSTVKCTENWERIKKNNFKLELFFLFFVISVDISIFHLIIFFFVFVL